MARWIDADAIKEKAWKAESEACFYALEDVVSVTDIDEAPSIDIVRCSECKWLTEDQYDDPYCEMHDIGMYDDDFCSYGEAKEK